MLKVLFSAENGLSGLFFLYYFSGNCSRMSGQLTSVFLSAPHVAGVCWTSRCTRSQGQ